jgi:hypothetical protein
MDLGGLLSIILSLDASLFLINGSCDPQPHKIIKQITGIIHLTAIPGASPIGKPLKEFTFKYFTKRLNRYRRELLLDVPPLVESTNRSTSFFGKPWIKGPPARLRHPEPTP